LAQPVIEECQHEVMMCPDILDRLVHHAHRIEMKGDSMRNNRPKANS